MLSLERCRKLKEAGFPQTTSDWVWIDVPGIDPAQHKPWSRSDACVVAGFNIDSPELIACPNSDELLVNIAARYGYTCWQDIVGDAERLVDHPEYDLNDTLAQLWLVRAKERAA